MHPAKALGFLLPYEPPLTGRFLLLGVTMDQYQGLRIRVPLYLREAVKEQAELEDRPLSAIIRRLLREALIARGAIDDTLNTRQAQA
jgi:hypothetical protein